MAAALWLIGGLIAIAAEAAFGDFTLLMIGGGALVTAGATFGLGLPYWAQGIVFALTSIALLTTVTGISPIAVLCWGALFLAMMFWLPSIEGKRVCWQVGGLVLAVA